MKSAFFAAALLVLTGSAHATTVINFGPTSDDSDGPTIAFNNLVTPTGIVGDATISVTLNGDLNLSSEFVDITLDGFSLGRVLNDDESDDPFNFPNGDDVAAGVNTTGTATIANVDFATLIVDGFLNLVFDFSDNVNCCGAVNHLSGFISFEEANPPIIDGPIDQVDVSAVPLPASALLLIGGLAGLGAAGRRKARKQA